MAAVNTAPSAATAVHDTTELLENILRFLPQEDRVPLASRKCRAVIKDSKVLRKILWLEPELPICRWRYYETFSETEMTRCLQKVAGDCPLERFSSHYSVGGELVSNVQVREGLRLNPMVFDLSDPLASCSGRRLVRSFLYAGQYFGFRAWMFKLGPYHSLRAMLVTQRPISELGVVDENYSLLNVRNATGITVADLLSTVKELQYAYITHIPDSIVVTEEFQHAGKVDEVVYKRNYFDGTDEA